MKLVTYEHNGRVAIGLLRDEYIIDLSAVASDMIELIESGEQGLAQARAVAKVAGNAIPLSDARLLPPIHIPRRNIM